MSHFGGLIPIQGEKIHLFCSGKGKSLRGFDGWHSLGLVNVDSRDAIPLI